MSHMGGVVNDTRQASCPSAAATSARTDVGRSYDNGILAGTRFELEVSMDQPLISMSARSLRKSTSLAATTLRSSNSG
ncbi:hypothetical protein [Mycolicibacterium sp. XJ775]